MKKIFLFFITIFFLVINLNAQIKKGNWLIGGSGFYTNTNSKYTVFTNNTNDNSIYNQEVVNKNLNIGGNIGYFIGDKFIVGISPILINNIAKEKSLSGSPSSNETIISLGVFSRYYFLKSLDQKLNFLGEVAYGLSTQKLKNNESGKGKFSSIFIGPTYFLNENIGLELLIGFKNDNLDYNFQKSYYKNSNFSTKLGLQIYIH